MIVKREGMTTFVSAPAYEKSVIDNVGYVQSFSNIYHVKSVEGHEDTLVEIVLPNGVASMVVRADQIITAVQKCVIT